MRKNGVGDCHSGYFNERNINLTPLLLRVLLRLWAVSHDAHTLVYLLLDSRRITETICNFGNGVAVLSALFQVVFRVLAWCFGFRG